MLVNAVEILNKAKAGKYAVPQFNINNLEWTRYVLEACNEMNTPVILGVSEKAAKYMGGYKVACNMVSALIESLKIKIPVVLHLDHGRSLEACYAAIDGGFSSIMIDASSYDFDKNVETTRQAVTYARSKDVSVEAELGHIAGTEEGFTDRACYARVDESIKFVETTNVDYFAPALGSVHGLYKGEPDLDFDRMKEINNSISVPIVLHGGSGLPDELIVKAIDCGISKINIDTELRMAWTLAVRKFLNENKDEYDPRKIIGSGEKAIKEVVKNKIKLFGCENKNN